MKQANAQLPHDAVQALVERIDAMRDASRLIIGEVGRSLARRTPR